MAFQTHKEKELQLELLWARVEAGHPIWLRKTRDPKNTKLTMPRAYAERLSIRDLDSYRCGLVETQEEWEAMVQVVGRLFKEGHPVYVCVFGDAKE